MLRTTITLRTLLGFSLSLFGLCLVFLYVVFQARFLILGPQITLDPTHPGRHNQPVVTLVGNAQNITRLWLNDRLIYTDRDGHFKEALVLENGYTIATLTAEDRYGRKTSLEREFVFMPGTLYK
ncbi:hypothetical protein K2Q16_00545 [Patescibacteria group bacterium]|nr:hypothetical protein [Patescibacteria group bacterium]